MMAREMMIDTRAQRHLNAPRAAEHQVAQRSIKFIQGQHMLQRRTLTELMRLLVSLHRPEVASQPEITDDRQRLESCLVVADHQSALLQHS